MSAEILPLPVRPMPYPAACAELRLAYCGWMAWVQVIDETRRSGINAEALPDMGKREALAWERWETAQELRQRAERRGSR